MSVAWGAMKTLEACIFYVDLYIKYGGLDTGQGSLAVICDVVMWFSLCCDVGAIMMK